MGQGGKEGGGEEEEGGGWCSGVSVGGSAGPDYTPTDRPTDRPHQSCRGHGRNNTEVGLGWAAASTIRCHDITSEVAIRPLGPVWLNSEIISLRALTR